MTSDRRVLPKSLVLLGVAVAMVTWASAGTALAQDNAAPAEQDAKAKEATKAQQDAADASSGAARRKRIGQLPRAISGKGLPAGSRNAGVQSKGRAVTPKPTVILKAGEVPNISFDTPSYDFGRVRAGQPIKHDFWFTNTGTGPLEILRVKPS